MGYQALVPAAHLHIAENSKLIFGREELFAANYSVYEELTTQLSNPGQRLCRRDFGKELRLCGSVLSLSLGNLEKNYYHFLVESIPRLVIMLQDEAIILRQIKEFGLASKMHAGTMKIPIIVRDCAAS